MESLNYFIGGFQIVLAPENLFTCLVGTILGTLIGVLPGLGPAATISLLLPVTFHMPPLPAMIMLAGIFYGAMYGGSTTSILVNIPGEAASVITCIEGHALAKKGRGGPALGIAAIGSFIGGTASVVGLMLLAVPLAKAALKFGPPEYFAILCLGMTLVLFLTQTDIAKSGVMTLLGLALGMVGMDIFTGDIRFGLGIYTLNDGLGLVPMVMGLFGISEIMLNFEKEIHRSLVKTGTKIKDLLPNLQDWLDSKMAIPRGTLIGFALGILPGGGAMIASFMSYAVEKKYSKWPERFGTGVIEGVAGPETANNAATAGSFVPLFALGIPPNVIMALMLSCLVVHGLQPGPTLISMHPQLFWGTVASMYLGNLMCLVFNLPMIGIWVQLLRIPYKLLFPLIVLFCLIGVYSINNSVFDIYVMLFFALLGYIFRKLDFDLPPFVLAFILGPMIESSLRQSLVLADGSFLIFFTRPIAGIAILLTLASIAFSAVPIFKKIRKKIAQEAERE